MKLGVIQKMRILQGLDTGGGGESGRCCERVWGGMVGMSVMGNPECH